MIRDFQLTIGDICGDRSGLRVKVEDVDIYDRVHFTVIERTEENEDEAGEMSYTAFLHRFTRLGNTSAKGNAA
ncbi:MAG: hypothetical protein DMG71_06940 [Acidobacteria bacterium]|nr:MAG: hypothetical protein DMG71_06940 [Acidobacteriota bacterium]